MKQTIKNVFKWIIYQAINFKVFDFITLHPFHFVQFQFQMLAELYNDWNLFKHLTIKNWKKSWIESDVNFCTVKKMMRKTLLTYVKAIK